MGAIFGINTTRMSIGSRRMGPPGTLFIMPRGHFVTYEDADADWMIPLGIGVSKIESLKWDVTTGSTPVSHHYSGD